MLFCRANLATSLIFLMESSSSRFRSATPRAGVDAILRRRRCRGVWRFHSAWRRRVFAAPGVALVLRFVLVEGRYRCGPIISRGPSSSAPTTDCALYKYRGGRTTLRVRLQSLPLRNEDLSVVTHTISMLQTAPRTGHFAKKVGAGRGPSASVMLRRAHRWRAGRLAGAGPRRPRRLRAPSGAI